MSMMRGKDRCRKRPCWAWLTWPDTRQSRDRIPLVTLVKAKLAALKMTDTLLGVEMLRLPSRLLYCSHMLKACSQARQRLDDACKERKERIRMKRKEKKREGKGREGKGREGYAFRRQLSLLTCHLA